MLIDVGRCRLLVVEVWTVEGSKVPLCAFHAGILRQMLGLRSDEVVAASRHDDRAARGDVADREVRRRLP